MIAKILTKWSFWATDKMSWYLNLRVKVVIVQQRVREINKINKTLEVKRIMSGVGRLASLSKFMEV